MNHSGHTVCASIAGLGYGLVHVCLCTLKGRPDETRQKVAQLREHNNKSNKNLKYKLPIERRPLEPASTVATNATRTNVRILCSPDMLSDSRTAPWFCVRISKPKSHTTNQGRINSANVTPRRALVRKLTRIT